MVKIKLKITFAALQKIFLFIGILFIGFLIHQIGLSTLWHHISRFGFWFAPIILLASLWHLSHAFAWYLIQKRFFATPSPFTFFRYKLIGEGVNMITPTGNIGGDTVRALLIRRMVPLREGVPVVVVDKTVDYIGRMVFIAGGLGISLFFVKIPRSFLWASLICLTIIVLGLVFLVFLQVRGFFKALLKISRFIPLLGKYLEKKRDSLNALDANLNMMYKKGRWRIALALIFHLCGRILGVIEIVVILRVLGLPLDFIDALFIATVTNIANSLFFLIPGQWGVLEGVSLLLVKTLGFSPALGLSLGIIRRIRRIFFLLLGMIFFSLEKRGKLHSRGADEMGSQGSGIEAGR